MAELPSGTVTFLFTDIERSTESAKALGNERWAEALQTHHDLLRPAFEKHGGVEVGTEGDSFFVAFAGAHDAVNAAVDGQRALETYAWAGQVRIRVRMGLHTGEALVRTGDYVGHDVHKAKRVSDAGHGGQILLSQATAELVRDVGKLTDLGLHRLKDLGEPQRVFQVATSDLQAQFPPLRSLDVANHNLPVQLTSFVGRERELGEVAAMLAAERLVTLMGVGGCGKTRLAIHAAAAELERSPHGVFFCDLSRVSDEEGLVPAVASSLSIELGGELGSIPILEALRRHLAPRTTLLVLDNCEHLVDAAAALAEDLLRSCPGLRILATSREALEVEGEHAWSVPSLDTAADAAQLFAERASAVRAGFVLTDENTSVARGICERLDGIPLAIELAAAQMGHLSARQIAERLDDRFMLLTGGRRRVQRQQTLQATMDWSWGLLEEHNRRLLSRLGVFQGGFTLEAAESVCGEGLDVVTGLRSLVGKSLVVAEDAGDTVRYRLLETVRLYAEDKLVDAEEVQQVRSRHRAYFLAWSRTTFDEFGPFHAFIDTPWEAEQHNIRAALRWSEAQGRHDLVADMLLWSALWTYAYAEGIRRISSALEAELEPKVRGRLLSGLSQLEVTTGAGASGLAHAEEAIEVLGNEPSPWLFFALQTKATQTGIEAVATQDPDRAEAAVDFGKRAAVVGKTLNQRWAVGTQLALGNVLMMLLRHIEAAEAHAVSLREMPPDQISTIQPVEGLFVARHIRSDAWTDALEATLRENHAKVLRLGRAKQPYMALDAAEQGRFVEAREIIREIYERTRSFAPTLFLRMPLLYDGIFAAMAEDWERAARLLAAAFQPGIILSASGYALYRHWLPRVRAQLDPQRARQLREEGRAMSIDEALAYAFSSDS